MLIFVKVETIRILVSLSFLGAKLQLFFNMCNLFVCNYPPPVLEKLICINQFYKNE